MANHRVSFKFGVLLLIGCVVASAGRPVLAADDAKAAAEKAAAVKSAAQMLPPTTLFYAEVERPAEVIRLVLDHPLRKRLEQSPDYRKAFDTPQFKEFQAVVNAVETRSGVEWRKALETTAGGGFAVGFDVATQGVAGLARSTDPQTTTKVRDALFDLAREDAKNKGNPDPIETKEYRGITAWKAGDSVIAPIGPWLLVTNKADLGKAIADALLDGGKTLAGDDDFTAALKLEQSKATADRGTAWAFVRLAPLRLFAPGHPVFDKNAKSDNPAAELLFGGLAGDVRNAPFITGTLKLHEQGIKLSVTSPHDRSWVPQGRDFFFAPKGQAGGADKPLRPKGTLLSITTYRDLAAWWEAGPDTYSEGVAAKMAQADSGLSTFLGGKSFGTDVLGSFAPQIQFVVAQQDYKAAGVPEPTIRLPAGALVLRLKDKPKTDVRKHFRVAFQSIVALGNLDGASKGRPLLEMKTEKRGDAEILYAVYEAPTEQETGSAKTEESAKPQAADAGKGEMKGGAEKDIYYNFSPALVLSSNHVMLCSTKQIADELADQAAGGGGASAAKIAQNTLVEVSASPIAVLLKANREQLVAQNMLEKGHSREQAEKEIDVFVALVNAVRQARLSLTPTDKSVTLEIEIQTAEMK
jgi:hypothetical protein